MSNITPEKYRRPVRYTSDKPSRTEKAHAEDVNIHNILKRFERTGVVEHINRFQGTYADYIDAPSYQEAMQQIAEAKTMFESVPARIRADFGNDPAAFIAFMQDPNQREAIEAYGLDASHLPEVSQPLAKEKPTESSEKQTEEE